MTKQKFNGHQKRVTLNLARLSAVARKDSELAVALDKLPGIAWDLYALPQADVEAIYTRFDEQLESDVKGEFHADPEYLVDLGTTIGTSCPLCGHEGVRWLFKVDNHAGGQGVECGSECIITHKLAVKGAETGKHAKRVLEAAIRRRMRKMILEAWHKDTGFMPMHFVDAGEALREIVATYDMQAQHYAARGFLHDLQTLERFYTRYGWIGTQKKWAMWERLVEFLRFNGVDTIPPTKPFKRYSAAVKKPAEGVSTTKSGAVKMVAGHKMVLSAGQAQLEMPLATTVAEVVAQ